MFGGGSFTSQNKVLPGSYINFVSVARAAAAVSDRGIVAVPLTLSWGPEKTAFEVTAEDFQKNCMAIFGYPYEAPELLPLREVFRYAVKGVFYRLVAGTKAANNYATARYGGVRGNSIKIVVAKNVDDESKYDVKTYLDSKLVDEQTVATAAGLTDNDYVIFKKDSTLAATAGIALAGGADGEAPTGTEHSAFLAAMESHTFHVLCCPVTDDSTKALYVSYTKRLRDEAGVKFQTVMFQKAADYEGVISVENETEELEHGLVYWTAGAEAACAVNKTNDNRTYDGEYTVKADYTQTQLSEGIKAGKFMFHKVGNEIRVLMDINTLTHYTDEKSEDFSSNQTIRVLDQIGNDIASMFNDRYLGKVPNDDAGRVSLWNDIVTYGNKLAGIRAIEAVTADNITVEKGQNKRSVTVSFPVEPINCMSQLYMTVVVQ